MHPRWIEYGLKLIVLTVAFTILPRLSDTYSTMQQENSSSHFKGKVTHFGKYAYQLSCRELNMVG